MLFLYALESPEHVDNPTTVYFCTNVRCCRDMVEQSLHYQKLQGQMSKVVGPTVH